MAQVYTLGLTGIEYTTIYRVATYAKQMDTKNNTGEENSGNWNSGYRNSGNWNSGYRNSGYGNSTNRESGIFNSEEPNIRMFNKPTNKKWDEIDHPSFVEFYLNKWIPESEMTKEEKKADPNFHVRQGYLKTFSWNEAWDNFWRDTDEDNRKKFLALPNFDPKIFKDITGIDVEAVNEVSLSGKEVSVTIDGKTYTAVVK